MRGQEKRKSTYYVHTLEELGAFKSGDACKVEKSRARESFY